MSNFKNVKDLGGSTQPAPGTIKWHQINHLLNHQMQNALEEDEYHCMTVLARIYKFLDQCDREGNNIFSASIFRTEINNIEEQVRREAEQARIQEAQRLAELQRLKEEEMSKVETAQAWKQLRYDNAAQGYDEYESMLSGTSSKLKDNL